MANHTQLPYCTVQRKHGDFCDAPSVEDAPFPICQAHVDRLLKHYQQEPLELGREMMQRFTEQMDLRRPEYSAAALEAMRLNEAQALVYYVRVREGRIKIGYTTQMKQRLSALRVDETELLATEPGGRDAEAQRHTQFAHLRIGRTEDFRDAPELFELIDLLHGQFGPPMVTSVIRAAHLIA